MLLPLPAVLTLVAAAVAASCPLTTLLVTLDWADPAGEGRVGAGTASDPSSGCPLER